MATRVSWSLTASKARPPCVVFLRRRLRGSQREIRIQWFHSVGTVAALLWRQVPHGGGLLSAGLSVFLVFSISVGLCLGGYFMCRRRWFAAPAWIYPANIVYRSCLDCVDVQPVRVSRGLFRVLPALMSQSNRVSLSCRVFRVDVPIQPDESCFFKISFVFLTMASQGRCLVFFFYINETRTILCVVRSKKK